MGIASNDEAPACRERGVRGKCETDAPHESPTIELDLSSTRVPEFDKLQTIAVWFRWMVVNLADDNSGTEVGTEPYGAQSTGADHMPSR